MNPTIRLVLLCVAAGALAAAVVPAVQGRQTGRRSVGNTAEAERLERERREREMREGDLRERQFLLRNMTADREPAERPKPRLPVAQIREDFVRLQIVNNEAEMMPARRQTGREGRILPGVEQHDRG